MAGFLTTAGRSGFGRGAPDSFVAGFQPRTACRCSAGVPPMWSERTVSQAWWLPSVAARVRGQHLCGCRQEWKFDERVRERTLDLPDEWSKTAFLSVAPLHCSMDSY